MTKLSISLAVLLLSASVAFAQPATWHAKQPGHHQQQMAMQQLNLSEDQKAQMRNADEDFHKQMQALNSNENQTVKQQRDQRTALAKAHQAKLESILTSDQKAKLDQINSNAKKDHTAMTAKHLDKMKQELNLTDEQVSELKKEQAGLESRIAAIQNDNSLDRTAKMEQLKTLRADRKNNFEKMLTPEQMEKWQGMKKNKLHKTKKNHELRRHTQPAV